MQVEHILVESLLTGVGQQVTVNKEKYFCSLKDLLDFYHVQNIYHTYKLDRLPLSDLSIVSESFSVFKYFSIILPQPTPRNRQFIQIF